MKKVLFLEYVIRLWDWRERVGGERRRYICLYVKKIMGFVFFFCVFLDFVGLADESGMKVCGLWCLFLFIRGCDDIKGIFFEDS